MIRQPLVDGLSEADRRERDCIKQRFYSFILRDHPPVSFAIFFREFRELRTGALQVAPLRQVAAVGKGHVINGVRINIFEAALSELQFIIAEQRIPLDSVVR